MLAPDPTTTTQQLTNIFNSATLVTTWAQALGNARLPALTPQPSWYDSINGSLVKSQQNSLSWLTTSGPQVMAQVSQSFIDYANYFTPAATQLGTLITQIQQAGNIPTADQQAQLQAVVNQLYTRATAGQSAVQNQLAALSAFRMQMGSDHDALAAAVTAALAQADTNREAIAQVQLKIASIQQKIAALTTQANASTFSTGTTMAGMVISFTFGLALSGGTLALGGFAVAVLSIAAAAVKSEIFGSKLAQDYAELTTLMGNLADDQQQLAMVQGVLSNLSSLLDTNDEALANFTAFTTAWDMTVQALEYLGVVLAQPQIDVSKIPDLLALPATSTNWQQIATFAQQVQNAPIQVQALDAPLMTTTQPALRAV